MYGSRRVEGFKWISVTFRRLVHLLNEEIIFVCHSGNRSTSAARLLANAGYRVVDLRGGLIAWSRAGLPMTKGK
ncbi:MAG TPA: rhodanese-like domain-containing protein [Anaerolineaceae bacterium]|nr:rhodanese-like domain-containing protein [Anaerolineaceae bacterium]